MKIALVAHEIHDGGGMERCMASLARWLKNRGETVHLYTADDHCPLAEEGFPWTRIPAQKKPLFLRLWQFYHRSKKIIRWNEYDIIHTNGGIIPSQNVTTIHFCQAAWQQVLNDPRQRSTYKGFHQWRYWNRKLAGVYATHLERQATLTSKLVICVSKQAAIETEQYYKPKIKPKVVYNGVSITEFHPSQDLHERAMFRRSLGADPQDTVLLFVGGEFARKGLPTVLECLKRARDPHIKLWVSGREPLQHVFEALAQEMGVAQQVQFLGFFPDLSRLMQGADVFVFPSYYDSFGLVITEAMATGLPVITTPQAGVSEIIVHCENGFLLSSPDNAVELLQYVTMLRNNPELCRQVGQEALKTAASYTWDRNAEAIYQHYCELLARKSPAVLSAP